MGRFAELWLGQGHLDYDFDEAVDQLTLLCSAAGARVLLPLVSEPSWPAPIA